MQVKICGVTRPEDAAAAVRAGADYIGVILGAPSPRLRSGDVAARVFAAAEGALRVGVFADADPARIGEAVRAFSLDVVQLHGSEAPSVVDRVRDMGVRVWKAVRSRDGSELERAVAAYGPSCDGLLVDGWSELGYGGVGARAPWHALAPQRAALPANLLFVVAGGLTPDNVADAVKTLSPDVVDVSSGVEHAPGEKSIERIAAFIAAARGATPSAGART